MDSKIIKQFGQKVKYTDHVWTTISEKTGQLTVRLKDTTLPKGIYTLWLEGTENTPGFGMLYLGISGTDNQSKYQGVKQRWSSHAFKMTGISFDDPLTGLPGKSKRTSDTREFAKFRLELHNLGYELPKLLDKLYFRFINLKGVGVEKIAAMETRILETRIAKGQCRLNGAKRKPCLTIEEIKYFDNL
jgi:hypothetical protein